MHVRETGVLILVHKRRLRLCYAVVSTFCHSPGSSQNYSWDLTRPDTHTRSRKPSVWPHAEMKRRGIFYCSMAEPSGSPDMRFRSVD